MDDVLVWWAPAIITDDTLRLLNDAERARFDALRRPDDRSGFAAAHALVRLLVADDAGVASTEVEVVQRCDRCGRSHGQPHVLIGGQPGPAVSLAHAAGVVVAARAAHPVGVDLEPAARVDLRVAPIILSPDEQSALDALAPSGRATALTRTWVRKEAVLKAAGIGLLADPRELVLGPVLDAPHVAEWDRPGPWSIADLGLAAGFEAAVAVRSAPMPTITVRQIGALAVS